MYKFTRFFKSIYFWIATSILLLGILLGVFSQNNKFLSLIFLTSNKTFNVNILIGITGVYSFVYTIYLNVRKEEIEIKNKPRIERNTILLNDIVRFIVLSTNISTDINRVTGNKLYNFYDESIKENNNSMATNIDNMYEEFKNLRDKLCLLLSADSSIEPSNLENKIDEIHEEIKQSVSFYNNSTQTLNKEYTKRTDMCEHPDSLKNLLVEDPGNSENFVSKLVLHDFTKNFKTRLHNTYNLRKEIRALSSEYFKLQSENNYF